MNVNIRWRDVILMVMYYNIWKGRQVLINGFKKNINDIEVDYEEVKPELPYPAPWDPLERKIKNGQVKGLNDVS